ncbi:MAG TPA: hypothetical protein VJB10_01115 [Candidatus Peribacteraceae bacterium]|nr:hypothetical protein [Candidatus Peribacteraceae bacterium]
MFTRPSIKILGLLVVSAIAGLQVMHTATAQFVPPFNWASASCEARKTEFGKLLATDNIYDLQWTYEGMIQNILDPRCAFLGPWQPVGYVNDPELIIDPNVQEQLYYVPESGFFFVTYLQKNTIAFVFRVNVPDPFQYLAQKDARLMQSVAAGRALYAPPPPPPPPPPAVSPEAAPADGTMGTQGQMGDPLAGEEAAGTSSADSNQEDLFRQIEEIGAFAETSSSDRALFRKGKVVNQEMENAEGATTQQTGTPAEEDPVLQQLLEEQEALISGAETAEGEETPKESAEGQAEIPPTEEEQATAPAAPAEKGGFGLSTILIGVAAVVVGIVFAFIMLLRKKKSVTTGTADAPPPPQNIASGPQQKSERLEKALAAMDEKDTSTDTTT